MSDIKNLVSQNPITRRTLLKLSGYGMMAIPFLESLSIGKARGQSGNAPMGMTKNLVNLIAPEGCHHYRLQGFHSVLIVV